MKTFYILSRYGRYAASSRLRMYSIHNSLHLSKYTNKINILFRIDRFKTKGIIQRTTFLFSLLSSLFERIVLIHNVKKNDIVFIQYEILPFFTKWAELKIKKRGAFLILDFDDAFYLSYTNSKFKYLKNKYTDIIKIADLVITGSPLLTKYIVNYNSNVLEIPTTVQQLYPFNTIENCDEKFRIGWIGSSTTSKYIDQISSILYDYLSINTHSQLLLMGYKGELFSTSSNVQIIDWTEENESIFLSKIHVGIMPLSDDDWSNGKCGFKLIQYMAAGKPTISTPLAANIKIDGGIGNLFATSSIEWIENLNYFFENKTYSLEVGSKNREKAKSKYVFSAVLPFYEQAIKSFLR